MTESNGVKSADGQAITKDLVESLLVTYEKKVRNLKWILGEFFGERDEKEEEMPEPIRGRKVRTAPPGQSETPPSGPLPASGDGEKSAAERRVVPIFRGRRGVIARAIRGRKVGEEFTVRNLLDELKVEGDQDRKTYWGEAGQILKQMLEAGEVEQSRPAAGPHPAGWVRN